jgi:protein-tyrosine-phosphatase
MADTLSVPPPFVVTGGQETAVFGRSDDGAIPSAAMRILIVCTGNLCRSPMASAVLQHVLSERGCTGIEVASAGTWADSGHNATSEACAVVAERGMDLTPHRSRPLDRDELRRADLVIAMTSVHLREIESLDPESARKTLLLKELAELSFDEPPGEDLPRRLQRVLAAKRPSWRRALDLDDPMGLPRASYERCLAEIEQAVEVLATALCPDRS